MSFFAEISERLAALTGSSTPTQALEDLNEFDVRDIQAVRVSEGGGSLPSGGSTGEVLTKESNADGDVGWEASGGSQSVKAVDSGIITRADVLSSPVVVWTPAAGEFIIGGFAISGDCVDANANEFVIGLSSWDNPLGGLISSAGSGIGFAEGTDIPAVGPVYAGFNVDSSSGVAMLWTANTVITNAGPATLAAGHIWQGDQAGTTGNSTPDFAGNLGGSVMDNGITWTDLGAVASNSCQLRGFIVALVTP